MTDAPPATPVTPSLAEALGNWGKVLPVLAVLIACYSVEAEIVSMIPYGLGLLAYYSWQDYVRLGITWFPVGIVALGMVFGTLILFASAINLFILNKRLRARVDAIQRELGIASPARKGMVRHLLSLPEPKWRSIAFLISTSGMIASWVFLSDAMNLFTASAWLGAGFLILNGEEDLGAMFRVSLPGFWRGSTASAALLIVAAIVGGVAGYQAKHPREQAQPTRIVVKSAQSASVVAGGCRVIRVLTNTLLASCNGKAVALNNSIVELVEYPPVEK